MTRFKVTVTAFVAGLALAATPALAQRPTQDSGPRGSAEPRGGGSNSGGGSSAGSSSSSPSGGSAAGSTASSSSSSAPSSAGSSGGASPSHSSGARPAPEHRWGMDRDNARSAGNQGTAVTRPTADSAGAAGPHRVVGSDDQVPGWSRPRGDHGTTGTAVPRTSAPPPRGGNNGYAPYYYDPYSNYFGYNPYGYGGYRSYYGPGYYYPGGYGLGLGMFWDPWSYGDPSAYGGYYDPYGGYSSGYNYSSSSSSQQGYREQGAVRLKIKPRDAKVYVDGYFVGIVDSFDGVFQKLNVPAGPHKLEIKADGYETVTVDVLVVPGETVTYQGELKRIQ